MPPQSLPVFLHKDTTRKKQYCSILLFCSLVAVFAFAPVFVIAAQVPTLPVEERRLATGFAGSLLIREQGIPWVWGDSQYPVEQDPAPLRLPGTVPNRLPYPQFFAGVASAARGKNATFLLRRDGSLWALGNNDDGRLGLPKGQGSGVVPQRVMDAVAQVRTFGTLTYALKQDGSLWRWGSNMLPEKLLEGVRKVAPAPTHAFALMHNGEIMAWGNPRHNELTVRSPEHLDVPAPVVADILPKGSIVDIATDSGICLALTKDGRLIRWGESEAPQAKQAWPEGFPTENVRAVHAANGRVYVITRDNMLWGAGYRAGQGDAAHKGASPLLHDVAEVSAYTQGLALKNDGSLWVWGENAHHELGLRAAQQLYPKELVFADQLVPFALCQPGQGREPKEPENPAGKVLFGPSGILRLSPGGDLWQHNKYRSAHMLRAITKVQRIQNAVFALDAGGLVHGFGYNDEAAFAEPSLAAGFSSLMPKDVRVLMHNVRDVAASSMQSVYVVRGTGAVDGWGRSLVGEFPQAESSLYSPSVQTSPYTVIAGGAQQVSTNTHSLALMQDGSLLAWGENSQGQLGNGTMSHSAVPVPVSMPLCEPGSITQVLAGFEQSALIVNNVLWLWGKRALVEHPAEPRSSTVPQPVNFGVTQVQRVALGPGFMLVLLRNGTLWSVGDNHYGELGDGTRQPRSTPYRLLNQVVSMDIDGHTCLALQKDGSLWGWGRNEQGQLLVDTVEPVLSPVRITLQQTFTVRADNMGALSLMPSVGLKFGQWLRDKVLPLLAHP